MTDQRSLALYHSHSSCPTCLFQVPKGMTEDFRTTVFVIIVDKIVILMVKKEEVCPLPKTPP